MNTEQNTEKQGHNRKNEEEEFEKIKAELEIATEKIIYFEDIIKSADNLRKLAESKIIETESKKLDTITNKLDSQIQSIGELVRKAEIKREEAIDKLLDAEVRLIVVENRILHAKVTNF
ncbi:hypothetical protein RG963_11205 [Methanosarcina sp. Z-7115]|uniref:Uncharacterized protein n=1 Tax=Methanosarcina baikalica TaxID=3073890 RepID=A0ABU2D2Y3_9EURY|nr:hypothetical protein [Methanosarcina sp. Z-7115]MDR7666337.1 hypothetical protein [Methanosarcina sp. Z-7115]